MVTDEQVRLFTSLLKQGLSQATAAAKAGMSERTARKYVRSGGTSSEAKAPHTWRNRVDPFAEVWPEIEALLRQVGGAASEDGVGGTEPATCRPVQRRTAAHPAAAVPSVAREVGPDCGGGVFPQTHVPGNKGNRTLPTCASSKWSSPANRSRTCCARRLRASRGFETAP